MSVLRFLFIDQMSETISALDGLARSDTVMFLESLDDFKAINQHKKKIAFLLSAMRHFAEELREQGHHVVYLKLDDSKSSGDVEFEIKKIIRARQIAKLIVTEPSEYRQAQLIKSWTAKLGVAVEIRPDHRFLCNLSEFKDWAEDKKQLRMEFFYREMRKKYNILLGSDGSPVGGQWNYDKENRKKLPKGTKIPRRIWHLKSQITIDVLKLVTERFDTHFGTLEPFHFAVTRAQALKELHHFIEVVLPDFGDHQDAMAKGEPYLFHSLISSYLNVGLLLPLEICKLAEGAYCAGKAPLNAVEGFIRQILGWREFIRGIYWLHMPDYAELNSLQAHRPLPDFYWTAKTTMACVAEAVSHTRDHAYSHHIQRLMITGNFALLAGLDVKQVQDWYLGVYSDAFEWVEMPNTLGMALHGDGGLVGSKPYAASGKYIDRMSNYCSHCTYDADVNVGEKACPFNALYWDFLVRHEMEFRQNRRMPYAYSNWDQFSPDKQNAIRQQAKQTLQRMDENDL